MSSYPPAVYNQSMSDICNRRLRPILIRAPWLLLALITLLSGCNFNVKNLAKNDVDMIVDQHIIELQRLTDQLLIKLYKRNPKELAKAPGKTIDRRLQQLSLGQVNRSSHTPPANSSSNSPDYRFAELNRQVGEGALKLAFSPDYGGDRVFAMMVGLKSMLHASYNMQTELFILDKLDQQLLYHSARNLEIINWRLNNVKDQHNQPYLLSNGYHNGVANLSFERLFGKMILIQDMMAKVVADTNNRAITSVLHGVASTTLLPIPF